MTHLGLLCLALAAAPVWADGGTPLETPPLPGLVASGTLGARLAAARKALGPGYVPRTRHLSVEGTPKYTNRLILETSPYLQQHAHNPVNWYPWGDEALARAKAEGKLLFISVGYSTCHWCHVMERESFEDEAIAALINRHFVPIKVDREERPDIDAVFMSAVHALSGRGGWPMTIVATPEGEPFFAATYLPPYDSPEGGRGLSSLLRRLADVYASDPARVGKVARQVTSELDRRARPGAPGALPDAGVLDSAVADLVASFDATNGGFGEAPKFPSPASLELLLRQHRRTGDAKALQIATRTLQAMARGGIYDQLGGGFHRYSTDAHWRVPHFEKMLYDNAQLAALYLDAYQLTGEAEFATVARETLAYLERDMLSAEGAFFSASDADSVVDGGDGEREGYFFTWTPAELRRVLGPAVASHVAAVYGVTERGDLDGRSVLRREFPLVTLAQRLGLEVRQLQRELDEARPRLLAARARRRPPARDEKIIAAWNGLAISAFARGAIVLDEPGWAARATKVAEFVTGPMLRDGRLSRSWRGGRASGAGTLEDYAFVEQGLLDLHEATQDPRWLTFARTLQGALDAHFTGPASSAYFRASDEVPRLLFREVPDDDGAEPSGNSVAALNLLRLHELTDAPAYRERALAVLRAQAGVASRGFGAHKLLSALDFALATPAQIVIVEPTPGASGRLLEAFRQVYQPNHVLLRAVEGTELQARQRDLPALEDRVARKGLATAYVCRHRTCELPTSDPALFRKQLERR